MDYFSNRFITRFMIYQSSLFSYYERSEKYIDVSLIICFCFSTRFLENKLLCWKIIRSGLMRNLVKHWIWFRNSSIELISGLKLWTNWENSKFTAMIVTMNELDKTLLSNFCSIGFFFIFIFWLRKFFLWNALN